MSKAIWQVFIDFGIMAILLLIGQFCRAKISIFQKALIPAALIGGILALIFGPRGYGLLPLSPQFGVYAAVLIVVIFAATPIGDTPSKDKVNSKVIGGMFFNLTGIAILQYAVGMFLTIYVIQFIWPEVTDPFGLMMATGYYGGHGTAAAVGPVLESLGYANMTDLFYYKRRDDGSSDPIKKVKFTTALNTDILKRLAECESYEVSSKDPHFKSVDGMIYSKDGKTLVRIPLGRKKVVISDKCSTVATRSYGYRTYGMSVLREIVFPKSVVKITSDNDLNFDISHYKCENIKVSLNMSQLDNKSIQRLWTTNKYWKKSLKNELLRKGFASLNEKNERMLMLADGYLCSYLKKEETDTDETETREDIVGLVIPDNVKTIGTEAFSEYDISYITLENGVEFIEDYAFEGCGLKDENDNWYAVVYVKRDNIHISDKAFAGGESVRIVMEK